MSKITVNYTAVRVEIALSPCLKNDMRKQQNMKVFGNTRVFLKRLSLPVKEINLRGINSLAVIPRTSSSQGKINNDQNSISGLQTDSTLSQEQTEAVLNVVDTNLNRFTIGSRGTKRPQVDELSPDLSDSGHLDKKVLKQMSQNNEESINIPSGSNIEDWVNKISNIAEIPEESKIPENSLYESIARVDNFHERYLELISKYTDIKTVANKLVDEINMSHELLEMYMDDVRVRVREVIPSSFSEDIDYDSTFESDSENGNAIPDNTNIGLYLPTDSEDNSELSNDANSVSKYLKDANFASENSNDANSVSENLNDVNSVSENTNNASLVSGNTNNASLVPGNTIDSPINPELADNPELTVYNKPASDDDVLSINNSTDVSDPYTGVGLEPLDSGLKLNESTYSGMLRQDQHIHSNYLINLRGDDTMEYRATYEYLIDTLNHLDDLIFKYNLVHYLENLLIWWNPNIDIYSDVLKSEICDILDLISMFN